jgi:two-component system, sensor histidine kinase PdtaS
MAKIMMSNLFNKIKTIKIWNLLWISLILSEGFTAIMNILTGLLWYGRVDTDLLLIGSLDAFVVALFVSIIIIFLFRQIRSNERHSEEAILRAKQEWERTFDSMSDLIMILDRQHKIVRANKAMADKLRLTPAQTVGITCYEHVHGLTDPPSFCPHSMCTLYGQEHSAEVHEECFGGHYLVTVTPWCNAKGEVVGSVHTAKDITERKLMEQLLRESEERLRQAVRLSHIGIFDHRHGADTIYWSPEQRKTYGWGAEETVNLPAFFECIYPEDRERVAEAVRRAHDPAGNGLFDVEHRIIRRDQEVRWLSTRSQTFFEGEGGVRRPVRTVGASLDITERKRAEKKLKESDTL